MKISLIILLGKKHYSLIDNIIKENKNFDEIIIATNITDKKLVYNLKNKTTAYKNAKLLYLQTNDFSKMRNLGLSSAKNNWVLYLDADEKLDDELKSVLLKYRLDNSLAGYRISRQDIFLGKKLNYGETLKQRLIGILRLVNKKVSGKWIGKVHEIYITSGKTAKLPGKILHYSHTDITDFLEKINYYSDLRSEELLKRKVTAVEVFIVPVLKFIYSFFILLGFLDRAEGFIYSFMMSFHSFLARSKAYAKQNT
ncbi:MAG: LPS biosynthesis protein [Patescibacteria group bacterium]|nr:MAG: LPS biosynthesis protein [Patescibacteria group bacterium]